MKILGIADGMVSGAALIENGRIAAAINEERLIRKKMAVGFPLNSIHKVLEVSQIDPSDIDYVAVAQLSSFFSYQPSPWVDWLKPHRNYGKRCLDTLSSHLAPVIGGSKISWITYKKILSLSTLDSRIHALLSVFLSRRKDYAMVLKHLSMRCPSLFFGARDLTF